MIYLYRKTTKTDAVRKTIFANFEDLEFYLSSLVSAYFDRGSFTIESDNFKELSAKFVSFYNPEYYTIDKDLEVITLNKLKQGGKRILPTLPKRKRKTVLENFLKTYDSHFNLGTSELTFYHNDNKISCNYNQNTHDIREIKINGIDFDDLVEAINYARKVKSRFRRIQKRQNKRA